MIITEKKLEQEINRYFTEDEESRAKITDICKNILDDRNIVCACGQIYLLRQACKSTLNNKSIENVCNQIETYRKQFKTTNALPNKSTNNRNTIKLPVWFRYLVYLVISGYLRGTLPQTKTQSDLLKDMGLSPDMFTKHWKMYAPNFALKQDKYEKIDLNIATDEIESNELYLAMIHYLVRNADIYTDTFVDVYAKKGIVPSLCAGGFPNRIALVDDMDLENFIKGLSKSVKVYKEVEKFRKYITRKDIEYDQIESARILAKQINMFIAGIATMKDEEVTFDEFKPLRFKFEGLEETYFDWDYFWNLSEEYVQSYYLSALRFVAYYFYPKYWENMYIEDSSLAIDEEQQYEEKLNSFKSIDKEYFRKLNSLYKGLKIENLWGIEDLLNSNYFLYINVPKFMIEQERNDFDIEFYDSLIGFLSTYKGNWILTWTTFNVYNTLYRENEKLLKGYSSVNDMTAIKELMDKIEYIEQQTEKGVYVFSAHLKTRQKGKSNNIVFITNIDFDEVDNKSFGVHYDINFNVSFKKRKFSKFKKDWFKWIDSRLR